MTTSFEKKADYLQLRAKGLNQTEAAIQAGISRTTVARMESEFRKHDISLVQAARDPAKALIKAKERKRKTLEHTSTIGAKLLTLEEQTAPEPLEFRDLCPEAARALEDFSYFQQRYFGRIATPWQAEAAQRVIQFLDSPVQEYVVVNCPPGSGKTTLFTHDIPAWLTCRNRSIRGLCGSATGRLAMNSLLRLRRTFERTVVEKADPVDVERGLAMDQESTLAVDYGRFKPLGQEIWARDGFFVEQMPSRGSTTEKEPTWSSYGIDSGFLGGRFDFVIWDDLVDPRKFASLEAKEKLQDDYQDLCETRLEPGGLLVLQGQRLASDDLYRFSLDMTRPLDDEDEMLEKMSEEEVIAKRSDKKYHHIVFKAHYEEKCTEQHKRISPAYPDGCLLDPRRLSWRTLSTLMENRGDRFEVVYQQKDVDASEILVQPAWIYGHENNVGCIDHDRDILEIPRDISDRSQLQSIATADPSPTNFWSVQWWLYDPTTEKRYLMNLLRTKMDAPDFLDRVGNAYVGVMNDWQQASMTLGVPITTWIVEQNAAQRFLLQYNHVKTWQGINSVDIIAHTTTRNKSDADFGVHTLAPHYRYGRVRLPGRGEGRQVATHLINEVTRYPHGRTDDCVMAEWFFEWNLPDLQPTKSSGRKAWRPTWAGGQDVAV